MIKDYQDIDDLVQGIKAILSDNRCSYSSEERELLVNCMLKLQETKDKKLEINLELILKVVEILATFFGLISS
ncbi:MAG: hypothetical protein N4A71_06675 [Carboxylicivirga sp.]|jgi:hypothetical protein|nr:hypothetical protein [Carboxylicivirga sp.]